MEEALGSWLDISFLGRRTMNVGNKYSNTQASLSVLLLFVLPSISTLVLKSVYISPPEHGWRRVENELWHQKEVWGRDHGELSNTHLLKKKGDNTLTAFLHSATVCPLKKYSIYMTASTLGGDKFSRS